MYIPSVGNHCLGDNKAQVLSKLFFKYSLSWVQVSKRECQNVKNKSPVKEGVCGLGSCLINTGDVNFLSGKTVLEMFYIVVCNINAM